MQSSSCNWGKGTLPLEYFYIAKLVSGSDGKSGSATQLEIMQQITLTYVVVMTSLISFT